MWIFPPETPGFSNCDLYSSPSSSSDSQPDTGFSDGSSKGSTSANLAVEHVIAKSFSSVNKDSEILESDQNSETEELLDELINWSKYVDPCLFLAFKNEKVTDHRVLRKWLGKLCQAIFNPQNPLFLACPNDPTSFFPNPELEIEPFHLDCMSFTGKVIALAVKHEIQVGIAFDRVFLSQLAGKNISVEDVKDADPPLYKRCKNVLNMDYAQFVAQELSSSEAFELFPGGGSKEAYVSHLIQRQFVTSIAKQVSFFAQGFDSVISKSGLRFELQDLDHILRRKRNADHFHRKRKSASHKNNESDSLMSRFQKVRRHKLDIKNWQRGQLLGRESYGLVYVVLAYEGLFFAVKEVPLVDDVILYQSEQEITLLSQLSHQNIVEFVGTRKDESKLYIFFELVRGGFLERLYRKFHLEDSLVSVYTRYIIEGLEYLHDRNVIHRDIKCANILLDEKGCVKIANFVLAEVIKSSILIKSCRGTLNWMAPEVINPKRGGYGLKADIWSLGCTVLEMLTRQIPYFHLERGAIEYNTGKGNLPHVPDSLPRDAKDLILQCLQVNPNDRPTAAQLLKHPFVKGSRFVQLEM